MVEFAVMSPLLLMLLGGAMDFSRVFYHGMGLNNAARAGVQYALTKPNQMYDYTGMQDAARQAQPDLTGMTVTASMYCTSTPSHENDADDDELSTAEVVPCPTSGYARQYIQVVTAQNYSLMSSYLLLPKDLNLKGKAVMRVQ